MRSPYLACALLVLSAGCATRPSVRWFREDVHPVAVKGDRLLDQARIWTRDSVMQWRVVLITRDSISGIPDSLPDACSGCRVVLPVAVVDSLSVGYVTNGRGGRGDGDRESPWWLPLAILAFVLAP
jgi:hypothetical protein